MNELKKYLRFGVSPEDDWKIIFAVTVTIIFLVSILNVYIFVRVDRGEFFAVEEGEKTTKMLNIDVLRDTVSYYRNKAYNFESIINGISTPVPDPSL